jgi:hypothetical protein
MRLSGWQRIGVVASILWFIVGGFLGNKAALDDAGTKTSAQLDLCVTANKIRFGEYGPYDQVWTPCWNEHTTNYMRNAEGHWWVALAAAVVPIPIGWLLGWAILSTGRWIRGGFRGSA